MTKTDAEQHAKVWELAAKAINLELQKALDANLKMLVASRLAASDLAIAVSKGYELLGEVIDK